MFNTALIHTIFTQKTVLTVQSWIKCTSDVTAYMLSSCNQSYSSDLSLSPLLHNFMKVFENLIKRAFILSLADFKMGSQYWVVLLL